MVASNRIEWIDALRGFAIFLVVMGHMIQMRWWPDGLVIKEYIYSFHMPLFMLISGFFAKKCINITSRREKRAYIQRKAFQLLIPFSVFGLFFLLAHRLPNVWTDYILLGGREYWFLWVLFQCFAWTALCSSLYDRIVGKIKIPEWGRWLCLLLPLLLLQQSSETFASILSKDNFIYNYPFFVLGIALSVYPKLMSIAVNKKIGILSLCGYVIAMQLPSFTGIEYLRAVFAIQLLIAIFSTFIYSHPLEMAGRYSLEIYLMHYYLCYLVPHSTSNIMKQYIQQDLMLFGGGKHISDILIVMSIVAYSVTIMAFCMFVAKKLQKNDFIRKYCFGK